MITTHQTLFKQDSKGKIRTYFIESDGADYRMVTGLIDGKQIRTKWTTAKSKNSGRSNATTAEEQALIEIRARIVKKLAEHYHKTLEEAQALRHSFFAPMLATSDKAAKFEMQDGIFIIIDPKLDGMRMASLSTAYLSRKGKPIMAAHYIFDNLKEFLETHPTITLDGEIYNHKYKDNFQGLMKICRRTHLNKEDERLAKSNLEYHVYDMKDSSNPNMTAYDRKLWLDKHLKPLLIESIVVVEWVLVSDVDHFQEALDNNLSNGYEGSIGRLVDSVYENKRTTSLLKFKVFSDAEYILIDILKGKGNRSDIAGSAVVLVDGMKVGCGIKGSWDYSAKLLYDRMSFIGKDATVRYFGKTNDGKLRFPVLIDVNRLD